MIKDLILNNNYMEWLNKFTEKYNSFDDVYFIHNNKLKDEDLIFIERLKELFVELNKYAVKNNLIDKNIFNYVLNYKDKNYYISFNGECFSCDVVDNTKDIPIIDYKKFKKLYEKNMQDNFSKLDKRVYDTLKSTDLDKINYNLNSIKGPTLVSGVGGSNVVSEFASKVLTEKNKIITRNTEPRDFKYINTNLYKNVLACSYSGNNYGVELAFLNNLKHYLLASKENKGKDIINLTYNNNDKEKSFISLGATLIPCSVLLNYYLGKNLNHNILDLLEEYKYNFNTDCDAYEIFTGIDTSTASNYLESTMVESGIGIRIVHDKYSYCHGRSTLSTKKNNIAIYLKHKLNTTELDELLLQELPKYYKDVIVLDSCSSNILGEYNLLIQSMYLTKYIAEQKEKDLSGVDYSPIVKKLYYFKGDL